MPATTGRQSGISDKQRDWALRLIDAAHQAGDGQRALDTLTHHGGEIVIDSRGQRHIKGLTGYRGGTFTLAITDLKTKTYRTATRGPAPRPAAAHRTNGPAPTGSRSTTSPAGDRFRANAPSAPRFTPTAEQITIVELFKTGESLKIFAGAGAGKTSTLRLCVEAAPDRRGAFWAFNNSIVKAADRSFPRRLPQGGGIECRTVHSMAYRATPAVFIDRLKKSSRVHPDKIAANLGIQPIAITVPNPDGTSRRRVLAAGFLGSLVMAAITRFCQSAAEKPSRRHFGRVEGLDADGDWTNHETIAGALEKYLATVWDDICTPDGWAPFRHEHYLKMWALTHPVIPHDYLLVDEAQDLNGVMLGLVEDQLNAGKQVVCVGDTWQSINEWMGSINALEKLPITNEATLTKSFRFGPTVAAFANRILALLDTDFRIEGNEAVASTIGRGLKPADCVLARTNALAVRGYITERAEGGRPHLIGQVDDIRWFCKSARALQIVEERQSAETRLGSPAMAADVRRDLEAEQAALKGEWDREGFDGMRPHPDLACFSAWQEVRLFVSEYPEGKEIKLMVKLVEDFGAMEIVRSLDDMPEEGRATRVFSTAHKVKGREWDRVELSEDFAETLEECEPAELKLLYVAVTRGKLHVDPSRVGCLEGLWEGLESVAVA